MMLSLPALLKAQEVETITTPGGNTFTVPSRVYEITVETWGLVVVERVLTEEEVVVALIRVRP